DGNLVLPDEAVKLLYHAVEIVDDIVAAVAGVAGVKADPQLVAAGDTVVDAGQLLEAAADLRALSGHGLQGDAHRGVRCQDVVQAPDDLADACVHPGSHMRPGVQDEDPAPAGGGPLQLQGQEPLCQLIGLRLDRVGQIDDVGSVDDDIINPMFLHVLPGGPYVQLTDLFSSRVLGSAGV